MEETKVVVEIEHTIGFHCMNTSVNLLFTVAVLQSDLHHPDSCLHLLRLLRSPCSGFSVYGPLQALHVSKFW